VFKLKIMNIRLKNKEENSALNGIPLAPIKEEMDLGRPIA